MADAVMNLEEVNQPKERKRGFPKTQDGVVVSDKMSKTIVVAIKQMALHKEYKKYIRTTKKYYAHDEREEANVGDTVRIVETRPLSKNKRWRIQKVLERAK